MLCEVYRSGKRMDTYLYLPMGAEYQELPDQLQQQFGPASKVLTINLSERSQLARITSQALIEHLNDTGYYLQLPPKQELNA
ncbi:YcgL domain-containing protein [Idiomarina seosinensis]|uniref:YcgL domain-containing protein n=1 Tax=Idiomarina seosinensis TaxID=281739 RepID=UPI00384CF17B